MKKVFALIAALLLLVSPQVGAQTSKKKLYVTPICIANTVQAVDSYGVWLLMYMVTEKPSPLSCPIDLEPFKMSDEEPKEISGYKFRPLDPSWTWVLVFPRETKDKK